MLASPVPAALNEPVEIAMAAPTQNLSPLHYSGLLTDLYELTMAAGYIQNRFAARATFELFVRHLPEHRNYLVAAGLDQALDFIEHVHFAKEEVAYLRRLPLFRHVGQEFFDYLEAFKFTGDLWALPEGTIFFPGEPLLRVTAPIAEAQLMETSLLSIIHLQTVIASKAARVTTAAGARPVIEFGSRRAHGVEAGVLAARAAFIGGCQGTSNSFAGYRFGIPVYGTQAHSWIMAHEDEGRAFNNFLDVFPEQATLLVDTYDVRAAIEKIIALRRKPRGIRLDSGNVLADSVWARKRLDSIGWTDVQIFVSGDLTENRIETLISQGGCVDSFGVGTALSTSADSPSVGVIYKLVEVQFQDHVRSTAKFSAEKKTYPGRKQVFRFSGEDGKFSHDVIALEDEAFSGTEPQLVQVMREGRRMPEGGGSTAARVRDAQLRFTANRDRLPSHLLSLNPATPFPVHYSDRLETLSEEIRRIFVKTSQTGSRPTGASHVSSDTIFWAVDMQEDFIDPAGRLYVPGSEKIVTNINRLVQAARENGVLLISSADAHNLDDPELREWPPHCLKGSAGARLIREACAPAQLIIPNQRAFAFPEDLGSYQQVILEKNTLDVFDNPNTDLLLTMLSPTGSPTLAASPEFVVFGVVTEYCVRCTVEGLVRRGCRVALVRDAIQAIDQKKGEQVLSNLQTQGVVLLSTEDALRLLEPPLARAA